MPLRRRRLVLVGALAALLVVGAVLWRATAPADPSGAREVAEAWTEIHQERVADCAMLELFSDDYLRERGLDDGRCERDPSFFTHLFVESQTAGSTYELGDVVVDGREAVAEVREEGGKVPDLRLLMVHEDGEWLIEAIGAEAP